MNYIIFNNKTKTEMAQYLHAALSSPCIKTLEKAIAKGNLLSWPVKNLHFSKLIKTTMAAEKGHLDQERKCLHLTKDNTSLDDNFPKQSTNQANNTLITVFHPLVDNHLLQQKAYIDLTGRFTHRSSRDNSYIFSMYGYDTNSILIGP